MSSDNSCNAGKFKERAQVGYRPRNRSGGYAILIALLEGEQECLFSLRKKEVMNRAQYHSDASFLETNNTFYSAWSAMSALVRKGLVVTSGHPTKYALTNEGRKMAGQFQDQIKKVDLAAGDFCQCSNTKVASPHSNTPSQPQIISFVKQDSHKSNLDDSTEDESITSCTDTTATLHPGSYEVILICDSLEYQALLNSDKRKVKVDLFQDMLSSGIKFESQRLSVGDFIWVARSASHELVLPYIVERKRLDDLSKSIIDNRYQEQKERLVNTGLKPIYLIEMHSFKGTIDRDSLMNAVFLTNIRDDFIVKFTRDLFETMRYLVNFTSTLVNLYEGETLHAKLSESISKPMDTELMQLKYFQRRFSKTIPISLSDMFAKLLLQIPRVTESEAIAIIRQYPTLSSLLDRYGGLSERDGRSLLQDIKTHYTIGRRIGPNLSAVIYEFYMTNTASNLSNS